LGTVDDYRVFIGNLGNEVNEDHLKSVFGKYSSFAMVRVIRSKNGKTKGFGFLSFMDPNDYMRAIKEWTGSVRFARRARRRWLMACTFAGKYIGSRPVQLRKSDWKERDLAVKKTKQKEDRKRKRQLGLA
jgi:RNA recognition motif-containing protein